MVSPSDVMAKTDVFIDAPQLVYGMMAIMKRQAVMISQNTTRVVHATV